jgi:hypothetical protein
MFLAGSQPGVGWWIDDVQFTNTVVEDGCPNVVSRKSHAGTNFDVALPTSGKAGVEDRNPGSGNSHTLIYTLGTNLTAAGTATITQGTATAGTPVIGPAANQITVPLTNVSNAQHLFVTLDGVTANNGTVLNHVVGRIDVLLGDTNADGFVNSADIGQTKAQSGHGVDGTNFREDVNVDGFLNSADIGLVKSKSGTALP